MAKNGVSGKPDQQIRLSQGFQKRPVVGIAIKILYFGIGTAIKFIELLGGLRLSPGYNRKIKQAK